MTVQSHPLRFLIVCSLFGLSAGCATLPDVSRIMDDAPAPRSPQIDSANGPVSARNSKAIMARLKSSVAPTDLVERYSAVVESVSDSPMTKGNKVSLLADGKATYAAMFKALQGAKGHINLESFIIEDDETGRKFADLLLKKQLEGVAVHIIYDSVGSLSTPAAFFQRLTDAGAQVVGFNPLSPLEDRDTWSLTHRDHRKILIVDGKLAIIGGVNISKVYSSGYRRGHQKSAKAPIHWRDTDVQIEGPAVAELQKLFLDTWLRQKGPALAKGNFFPELKEQGSALVRVAGSTPGETNRIPFVIYVSAISFAEHSIHLTNSYFIPDQQIEKALIEAAGRGVDVKLMLPGITDSKLALYAQRHHYAALLKGGVRVYEHKSSLLHAKTAVIDGVWSTVGSTNLDYLSLLGNDEVNAVILSKEFALQMEEMFTRDLAESTPILREQWEKRPLLPRFGEWFVNLFQRWL
ncbi:cardiolipin synthase B [Geomonas silvestris]|uniref:Cardiolipin synthase B n=1 Tax=Geomonas silvestris TaxID=2740184 RepID=A0A6V8MNN0_9BACT|nr:phospholipase D-like domain-containing protein [Geomonas silvestris]GFO61477.1 cardiolipin synthase B [Geomonas silvestris]